MPYKVNWTKTLDMFVGKVPDQTLAKFIGCTTCSVYRRRLILGKSSYKYVKKCAKKFEDRYGKTEEEFLEWLKMKHPHFKPMEQYKINKESIVRDLPYLNNDQIIEKYKNISSTTLSRYRSEFNIPSPSNRNYANSKEGQRRLKGDFIRVMGYAMWLVDHIDEEGQQNFRYKRLKKFIEYAKKRYKGID